MSRRAAAILASAMLSLAGVTACGTISPSPHPEASGLEGLPQGQLISIDIGVAMSPDNRTVTIRFIGSPIYTPTDPCYNDYRGWARLVGQHLDLAVVMVIDPHPSPPVACPAVGEERVVTVVLVSPFLGTTATDLSDGRVVQVERPPS